MDVADFLRVYHVRAPQVMWFLGAGASAAANIATAGYMIWDFKRRLYCAAQRVPLAACQDLGDPALQAKLQDHFDASGAFPAPGADDEYAAFFEAVYPRDADRRRYIEDRVAAGTPSHGHLVLAALCKLNLARVVWTTNFDRVVEDAVAAVLGTSGRLITATLDTPDLARQALTEGRGPLLVKLHGDFHSRRLKNTTDELQAQDRKLRDALVDACRRGGLAVVGYSGRDHSIMDALEDALDEGEGFPQGLFWFHRGPWSPLPRVQALVARAQGLGIVGTLDDSQLKNVCRMIGADTRTWGWLSEPIRLRVRQFVATYRFAADDQHADVVRATAIDELRAPLLEGFERLDDVHCGEPNPRLRPDSAPAVRRGWWLAARRVPRRAAHGAARADLDGRAARRAPPLRRVESADLGRLPHAQDPRGGPRGGPAAGRGRRRRLAALHGGDDGAGYPVQRLPRSVRGTAGGARQPRHRRTGA